MLCLGAFLREGPPLPLLTFLLKSEVIKKVPMPSHIKKKNHRFFLVLLSFLHLLFIFQNYLLSYNMIFSVYNLPNIAESDTLLGTFITESYL